MRKSVTKIVKAVLGFTMAIGAFVGAAVSNNSETHKLVADGPTTISKTMTQIATANDWVTASGSGAQTCYTSFNLDNNIQISTTGSANCGSYWGSDWRLYQAQSGTFVVTPLNQATISSLTVTFSISNTGCLATSSGTNKTAYFSSGTAKTVNISAATTYYVANTSNKTNGQVKITAITAVYTLPSGGSEDPTLSVSGPDYLVDGTSGTIRGTIANDDSYTITWSANDANVSFTPTSSTSGENVSVEFDGVATGTTPIIITGTLNNEGDAVTGTKNIFALEHAGTQADPFSATDAHVFSNPTYVGLSGGDWYVEGYVVGTYQTNKGYYIDEDSEATSSHKFEVYNSSGVTNNTGKEIIVGTSYIVAHGSMTYYAGGSQCETTGSVITSVDNGAIPSVVIDGGNRTVDINDSLTLTATTENPDNAVVSWSSDAPLVATINSSTGAVALIGVGTANITASITVAAQEYTSTIVLTVERCPVEIGKTYVISAVYSETTYYLSGVESSLGTCSTNENEALVLTVEAGTQSGSYAFGNNGHYLKAKNGNNLETEDDVTDDSSWLVSYNGTTYSMHNVGQDTRLLSYNDNGHASDNNKINRFAAYTSQQSSPIIITEVTAPEVDEITVVGNSSVNANGAVSVVEDFLYEVSYVDPLNPGNGSVNVTVLNSSDGTDGASITSAPNGTSFSVTFTASDTYTVTVTSAEDNGKSNSVTITISNIYVPPVPVVNDYELYDEDVLVEGDYIIVYEGAAMNNTIDGDRAQYDDVTPVGDTISTDDASIVWHIAPATGDYFTIYNSEAGQYLASTGAKNKAQLLDDGSDDKSLWSVTVDGGAFDFTNKKNTANGVNAILRRNTTYGFACYASGTGGKLSLYRLNDIGAYLSSATAVATLTDDILRLGSSVQESVWNSVMATGEITDYGVMIYKTDSEAKITSDTPVEDAYRAGVVQPAIARKGNGTAPSLTNGTYVFTARVRVSNPNTIFCSASFVVVGGQYYFFNEQHISASQLAS